MTSHDENLQLKSRAQVGMHQILEAAPQGDVILENISQHVFLCRAWVIISSGVT